MYELTLLGDVQLRDDDGRTIRLRRHARALLAVLMMEPARSHSRRALAGLLWGGRDAASTFASLRQSLIQIRRACSDGELVGGNKDVLWLNGEVVTTDLDRLEAIAEPERLRSALERLSSRPLDGIDLDGSFADWLRAARDKVAARLSRRTEQLLSGEAQIEESIGSRRIEAGRQPSHATDPPPPPATAARVDITPSRSVAPAIHASAPPLLVVTPIRMVGAATSDRLLVDPTAELLLRLSRFRELRVTEAEATAPPPARAAFVLTGSVHGASSAQRLIVRLLATPGHEIIWADRVPVDAAIDAHLDRLAGRIACSMVLEDAPHLDCAVAAAGSFYGRFIKHRMQALWPASHTEALDAESGLRRLIAEDPRFAFAYLALVRLLNTDHAYTRALNQTPDRQAECLSLAQSALALDQTMAAAWLQVGFCLLRRHEWAAAQHHIETALALNSNDHTKLNIASTLYLFIGDLDKAEELLRRSLEFMRAPSGAYLSDFGLLRLMQGRYLEAYDVLRGAPRPLMFTQIYLAIAARMSGRPSDAIAAECRQRLSPIFGGGYSPSAGAIRDWVASHHPFRDPHARALLRDGIAASFA